MVAILSISTASFIRNSKCYFLIIFCKYVNRKINFCILLFIVFVVILFTFDFHQRINCFHACKKKHLPNVIRQFSILTFHIQLNNFFFIYVLFCCSLSCCFTLFPDKKNENVKERGKKIETFLKQKMRKSKQAVKRKKHSTEK